MHKVIGFRGENVQSVSLIECIFDENTDCITIGSENNGDGKSSAINVLLMTLLGKSFSKDDLIQNGKDSARGVVVTNKGYRIERKLNRQADGKTKQTLTIWDKTGATVKSPQKLLDSFCSEETIDPEAFATMDRKERLASYKKALGLDEPLEKIETKRKQIYDIRTEHNRNISFLEAKLVGIPEDLEGLPDELVDVEKLLAEAKFSERLQRYEDEARNLDQEIKTLTERRAQLGESIRALPACRNIDAVRQDLATAGGVNIRIERKKERKRLEVDLEVARAKAAECSEVIEKLAGKYASVIAGAPHVLPGLSVTDEDVTYNGIPIERLSDGERITVSTRFGLAMHPEIKVICIKRGSLLSETNKKSIISAAREAGGLVLIELVGTQGEPTIIMQDGVAVVNHLENKNAPKEAGDSPN